MVQFFLHIPKCGGTTIKQYYLSTFKKCIKVWNPVFSGHCLSPQFENIDISDAECIIGHLRFEDALKNDRFKRLFDKNEVKIISVVRDPIDRFISLYNYMRNYEKHPSYEKMRSTIFENFLLNSKSNFQCSMLGFDYWGSLCEMTKNIQIIDLERSNDFFYNYFKENFIYNAPIKDKANVTSINFGCDNLKKKSDIPNEVINRLKERNKLDYELYDIAKSVKY